jgi:hypothetical protein
MSNLSAEVRAYLSALGKKGGSVKGQSKARTREQAQRAVKARWEKFHQNKQLVQISENAPIRSGLPEIAP